MLIWEGSRKEHREERENERTVLTHLQAEKRYIFLIERSPCSQKNWGMLSGELCKVVSSFLELKLLRLVGSMEIYRRLKSAKLNQNPTQ